MAWSVPAEDAQLRSSTDKGVENAPPFGTFHQEFERSITQRPLLGGASYRFDSSLAL